LARGMENQALGWRQTSKSKTPGVKSWVREAGKERPPQAIAVTKKRKTEGVPGVADGGGTVK